MDGSSGLNLRRNYVQQGGSDGDQPFPQRRRIVSEPADAAFDAMLAANEFLDLEDNQSGDSPVDNRAGTQHNTILLDRLTTSNESQFDFLNESFDQDSSTSPPMTTATTMQFQTPSTSGKSEDCDRPFTRPERLRQHAVFKHAQPECHDCSQCGRSFSSKILLTRHLKTHDHECCGKSYSTYSTLMKHRKSHDQDEQAAATTTTAVTAPATPSKRGHKEQGEKRFQCVQCLKRFPTSKDLKRHDVVHTGNREFQCSFCSHRFGRKDHRMRHEKKTHALELQQQQTASKPSPKASPPAATIGETEIRVAADLVKRRLRHVSSPSTFRHDTASPPRTLFQNMLVSSPPTTVAKEEDELLEKREFFVKQEDLESDIKPEIKTEQLESIITMHDSMGLVKIVSTPDPRVDETSNGDLDAILSDIITVADPPSGPMMIDASTEKVLSASMPISSILGTSGTFSRSNFPSNFTSFALEPTQPQPNPPPVAPPPPQLPATVVLASSAPTSSFKSPKMTSDILTRTKNPVLPSVYIDNSLIVPDPSKQKYQSTSSTHSLLFESDFMDVDNFLRAGVGGGAAAAAAAAAAAGVSGDGKEIIESIFNM